ncbi:MAG: hypothetical protein HUJ25_02605 [Crocinitomicaceae bacterium]|nr:hypothetical protein [Crocinitomicaceae bacterium]
MRNIFLRAKYPGLTFLLSFAVLFYFFHTVLLAPNDYLFAPGGDGIKNYYTYLFHAKHDTEFWNFTGMNYPYYEHIVYTDAHPLLSYVIKFLGLQQFGIGILNFLMLLSYPVASVFLYLILRHYKVSVVWAVAAAIAITYLSPQLGRLMGHFSLAYAFAIPGMWWLLLKCRHGNSQLWAIISFLYLSCFFMTHPYLGMILVMLCLLFWFIAYLYNRSSWKTSAGFVAMQVVLPLVIFRVMVFITDTHVNRIDDPSGFFLLYGNWKSVLVPHSGPLSGLGPAMGLEMPAWESWAYVGFASILFFLYSLGYLIYDRKALPVKLIFKHELFMFFIAAFAMLLFSFCFPFKYEWMRWITDYVGTLKQFRALGRFAWIFYYVFTLGSIVTLFHIYKREGKRTLIATFFFVGVAFTLIEGHEDIGDVQEKITAQHNSFKEEHLSKDMKELVQYVEENDYDAFIFLPFFHYSSESIMILGEDQSVFDAYMLSYHSGLPMMNCMASRLSLTESIKFNNLFSPAFMEKEIVYDLPTNHKIALITNQDPLNDNETRMVSVHTKEFGNETYTLYPFDTEAWNNPSSYQEVLRKRDSARHKITENWKSSDPNVWFYYNSWNDKLSEGLKGKGGYNSTKRGFDLIWESSTENMDTGKYEVSFWFNHALDRADLLTITELYYKDDQHPGWVDTYELKESNVVLRQWLRAEMEFTVNQNVDSVKVFVLGNESRKPYAVDELLVRKATGADLFSTGKIGGQEYIIYNNFWLKDDAFRNK